MLHRSLRLSPYLLLLLVTLPITACGERAQGNASHDNLGFSGGDNHPYLGRFPLAVGSEVSLGVRAPNPMIIQIIGPPLDITDVSLEDEGVFEILGYEDDTIFLNAVGPGSTTLNVEGFGDRDDFYSGEFPLSAADIDRVEFEAECGDGFAYLTNTTYDASLRILDANGQLLQAAGFSPLTISGDGGQAHILDYVRAPPRDDRMFSRLFTGGQPGRYRFSPAPRGEVVELDVISPGGADVVVVNSKFLRRIDGERLRITPQLLFQNRPICGDEGIDGTYQIRSLTPERCEFIDSGQLSTEISAAYSTPSTLELKGSGECTVEVEVYADPGSEQAVVSRRSWDLDE